MEQPYTFQQRFHGAITTQDRMHIFRQRPVTIWLTGLSGAGKSTIAFKLEQQLVSLGRIFAYLRENGLVATGHEIGAQFRSVPLPPAAKEKTRKCGLQMRVFSFGRHASRRTSPCAPNRAS